MTKVIKCNREGCDTLLPDGDAAVITMKFCRREQFGLDGKLHPASKAKYECHQRWTDEEIERIAKFEADEAERRAQLRAEDMDGDDDELFNGAEAEAAADDDVIEMAYRQPAALAAGDA